MKKCISLLLALVLVLSVGVMGAGAADAADCFELRLGVSGCTVLVPASFVRGELSAEDIAEGQLGYYASEQSSMDFDLYQFSKEGEPAALAEYAAKEAAEYGAEAAETAINGIPVFCYEAVEEAEGESYTTRTYILDAGASYAELVFWLDGETAAAEAEAIMQTLQRMAALRLGESDYYVNVPDSYAEGDMTEEEVADGMVGYFQSEQSSMDFDVYQFSKEGEPTELAEYAAKEAAEYGAEAAGAVINGISVYCYEAVEEYDGESYTTLTAILDAGEDYVELVFWLDGETAADEAARILNSVKAQRALALGSSPFSVCVTLDYAEGEMTEEEVADGMVGYYQSEASEMDFDVYQFSKEGEPAALAEYAAREAAEYEAEPVGLEINGIPVFYYFAAEDYDGTAYTTLNVLFDTEEEYLELVFWLDGSRTAEQAMDILSTLSK